MLRVSFVKIMLAILMSALSLLSFGQQKYHDAVLSDLFGHVKSVTASNGYISQTISFSNEGQIEGNSIYDKKYDSNGYLISGSQMMNGMKADVTFKYDSNQRWVEILLKVAGGTVTMIAERDSEGIVISVTQAMSADGISQSTTEKYSDYEFDTHGNWIKRTFNTLNGGGEMTRTIEYW